MRTVVRARGREHQLVKPERMRDLAVDVATGAVMAVPREVVLPLGRRLRLVQHGAAHDVASDRLDPALAHILPVDDKRLVVVDVRCRSHLDALMDQWVSKHRRGPGNNLGVTLDEPNLHELCLAGHDLVAASQRRVQAPYGLRSLHGVHDTGGVGHTPHLTLWDHEESIMHLPRLRDASTDQRDGHCEGTLAAIGKLFEFFGAKREGLLAVSSLSPTDSLSVRTFRHLGRLQTWAHASCMAYGHAQAQLHTTTWRLAG
jgi:hypothetical protein